MGINNCTCRCRCVTAALIAAAVIGVLTAFLQITAVITVTPAFTWVALGIAVAYLAVLTVSAALTRRTEMDGCRCAGLSTALAGILGTALVAVILLAVGITATSVISAILVGALLFFLTLTLAGTACLVRSLSDCDA